MRNRGLPYFIVFLLASWSTRLFWMPSGFVVSFDTGTYAAPSWILGKRAFREGRLPLINDNIFGGVPHLGNPQTGVLSPLRWVSYLFDPTRGLNMLSAFHVLVLGWGMVFLARRLHMSRSAATCAGIVAVLCGATTTKSIQVEQIMVIAWLPWVLAFVHMVVEVPRRRAYIGLLSVALSIAILSGHPQMTYELMFTSAVFALGLLAVSFDRLRAARSLFIAVIVSVVTCSLQLAAAVAATGDSYISAGRDINALSSGDLVLRARSSMQAVFGTIRAGRSDVFAGAFESITYIGVVAVLLASMSAAVAVRRAQTRAWAAPLALMAGIGLIWSLGPRTPFFRLAFHLLPGFDQARVSTRWLIVVSLVVALFAAHAIDLIGQRVSRRAFSFVVGITLLAVVVVGLTPIASGGATTKVAWSISGLFVLCIVHAGTRSKVSTRENVARLAILLLATELLLLDRSSIVHVVESDVAVEDMIATTSDYLASADGYTIALTGESGGPQYLIPALRPNANAVFNVASIDGYDGGVQITKRWATSMRRFDESPAYDFLLRDSLAPPLDPERLARLGVRHVVLDITDIPSDLVPGWTGPVAEDDRFTVWENPAWLGDGWIYWRTASVDGAPADALRTRFDEFAQTAIVDGESTPLSCDINCRPIGLALEQLSPEHLRLPLNIERPGLLVIPRQALHGWQAFIDGQRTPIMQVDGLFLGVAAPAGSHVVELRYRPWWVTPSEWVSLLGVLITLVLLWDRPLRWRRSTPGAHR